MRGYSHAAAVRGLGTLQPSAGKIEYAVPSRRDRKALDRCLIQSLHRWAVPCPQCVRTTNVVRLSPSVN